MGLREISLFGMVILGGLAIGWMTPNEAASDAVSGPEADASSAPPPPPAGTAGTGGYWPNGNPVAAGDPDLAAAAPDPAERARNDARAAFRSEMAKSGVTPTRVFPDVGSAPAPAPQQMAAAAPQAARPASAPAPAPSGWGSPTSGANGWGVQAGVAPSTGPMAPPRATQPAPAAAQAAD